jgi:hypothetical protein
MKQTHNKTIISTPLSAGCDATAHIIFYGIRFSDSHDDIMAKLEDYKVFSASPFSGPETRGGYHEHIYYAFSIYKEDIFGYFFYEFYVTSPLPFFNFQFFFQNQGCTNYGPFKVLIRQTESLLEKN